MADAFPGYRQRNNDMDRILVFFIRKFPPIVLREIERNLGESIHWQCHTHVLAVFDEAFDDPNWRIEGYEDDDWRVPPDFTPLRSWELFG